MTNQVNGDNGPNVEGKGLHEAGEGLWLPLGNFHDDYDSDWSWSIYKFDIISWFFWEGKVAQFQTVMVDRHPFSRQHRT